jgi:uncharacterized protein (AIM24 family)
MQYQLLQKPDFTFVRVQFDQPGEQMLVEPSAMVAKESAVDMKTQMQGGILAAAKRKMLGGESVFQNTFTATAPGQRLYLAPGPEGDVDVIECDGRTPIFLSSGAFLASAPRVRDRCFSAATAGFTRSTWEPRATSATRVTSSASPAG